MLLLIKEEGLVLLYVYHTELLEMELLRLVATITLICFPQNFESWSEQMSWGITAAQWRTQKIFMGGGSFSGIWWWFVFGAHCLWCQNLTSYSCFQTKVLAKFVGIVCIFVCTHSLKCMCHWTENKLSALQVRISEENTLNATKQQFITAKISGCALKQGSNTHSSLRQRNLQLQSEAALMSFRIRGVEHRKIAAGLDCLTHTSVSSEVSDFTSCALHTDTF